MCLSLCERYNNGYAMRHVSLLFRYFVVNAQVDVVLLFLPGRRRREIFTDAPPFSVVRPRAQLLHRKGAVGMPLPASQTARPKPLRRCPPGAAASCWQELLAHGERYHVFFLESGGLRGGRRTVITRIYSSDQEVCMPRKICTGPSTARCIAERLLTELLRGNYFKCRTIIASRRKGKAT